MLSSTNATLKLATKTNSNVALLRSFSSEEGGFFSRIKKSLTGGASSRQDDAYAKQIFDMAHAESWNLSNFHQQIKASSGGWKAKLPGMSSTDAVKQMKAMQQLLEATMAVAGDNAGAPELKNMGKKEKLKISIHSGGTDLKDINALIEQFQSMDIMHRVLRYRVENGLEIPKDEDGAKTLMQNDIKKVLSPQELKEMQRARMKLMKKRY